MIERALLIILSAACALLAGAAQAAEPVAVYDKSGAIEAIELPNGLDVITIEDRAVPLVTIEIAVKNGAYTEPPELNGLSHLYEHMFFKGNAIIPNQEAYLARMRELGIVFNGTTSTERVNYFFTLPAENLEAGLAFMRDAIVTPRFEPKEFKKEIQVVLGEFDRNESSPYYWLAKAVDERLWYKYPTRKDSLGDRRTLDTASVEKMRTMQRRYYVPNNAALLIAGDIEPDRARQLARRLFSGWKRAPRDPHEAYPVPAHPPLKESSAVVVKKDQVRVPVVTLNWHGPSVTSDAKSTYAADVLSYIISQPDSGFYRRMIDSGLTLGAGLSYYTQAHTGPISASMQVAPEKIEPALQALTDELSRMDDEDYFSDEQLAAAKRILAVQHLFETEQPSSLAHTVSFWWASAGLEYYRDYQDNLAAVSRQDIQRFVRTYILGKPLVAGMLGSSEIASEYDAERLLSVISPPIDAQQKEES